MLKIRQNCCWNIGMIRLQEMPIEVPKTKPDIIPRKMTPGPLIRPEHPPTIIPEENPKEDNPKPPEVEPVPPEMEPEKEVA